MKKVKTMYILTTLLLALSSSSLGEEDITLSNVDDFIDFVNSVNSGSDYSGTTVYLDSDLSLSEKALDPIGTEAHQFLGVFDGQGHVISNLQVNTSSNITGLFGYSTGLTIRNVVLDNSCSITSTFNGSSKVQVGGIVGVCETISGHCTIESSVNMADVSFSGNTSSNLFIGGVVGTLSSSEYVFYVRNCVNYGSVTDFGTTSIAAELGGIVGISDGGQLSSKYHYIQNCLNYGTITHSGTSRNLAIGGIVGAGYSYTYIENCLSAGKITTQTAGSDSNYIGSITGYIYTNVYINYCYYTNDVNVNSIHGFAYFAPSITGTPDTPTDVNSGLIGNLNNQASSSNWDSWFMLHLNGGNINNLAQELFVEIQGHTPDPVKEGHSFLSWCKDAECTEEFDPETESVSGITDLYARWVAKYTVTFDFGNGTTVNATFNYNAEITYPDMKKEGYTLSWDNYHELMPAGDITVTAWLIPNNYTVTFDANGGEPFSDDKVTKTVAFNEKYGNLPEPSRAGYMFFGWFTNETSDTEVTNETILIIPDNHTLYARWEEVTTQVEIVFSKKGLTQEEAEELLKQYANADFEFIKFGEESGEIKAIIRFADKEEAEEFVRSIKGSDRAADMIKRIAFDQYNDDGSVSTMIYPLSFLNVLFS